MDAGRIFSRALELMGKYKFLWLFGLILGLTGGGAGSGNLNFRGGGDGMPFVNGRVEPALIGIAALVGVLVLLVGLVLFFYFRFVARGALVCAVRDIEAQGATTLADAWSGGRTFYSRLLGLGFLVNVPLVLFSIVLIAIAIVPLLGLILSAVSNRGEPPTALFAGLGVVGFFAICFAVLCLVVVYVVIHPLYEFAVRAIVLEDLHVREGLQRGIERARQNLGHVVVVYLLLIGARIGWGLITAILWLPFVFLGFLFVGGALSLDVNVLIVLGLLAAVPLWLLFGAVEGLFQTFESNVWTEAYLGLLGKPETA